MFSSSGQSPACESGWLLFEDTCFQLQRGRKSYYDAIHLCGTLHSTLAEIRSERENDFVGRLSSFKASVWIGYNDRVSHGHWVWNQAGLRTSYTRWKGGQPRGVGDCALMLGQNPPTWEPRRCASHHMFVCQKGMFDREYTQLQNFFLWILQQ